MRLRFARLSQVVVLATAVVALATGSLSAHDLFLKLDSYLLLPHTAVRITIVNGTVAAVWRGRKPFSRPAAIVGLLGARGLGAVGYLGGEIVYRHALGIPTEVLEGIVHERGGHVHD